MNYDYQVLLGDLKKYINKRGYGGALFLKNNQEHAYIVPEQHIISNGQVIDVNENEMVNVKKGEYDMIKRRFPEKYRETGRHKGGSHKRGKSKRNKSSKRKSHKNKHS